MYLCCSAPAETAWCDCVCLVLVPAVVAWHTAAFVLYASLLYASLRVGCGRVRLGGCLVIRVVVYGVMLPDIWHAWMSAAVCQHDSTNKTDSSSCCRRISCTTSKAACIVPCLPHWRVGGCCCQVYCFWLAGCRHYASVEPMSLQDTSTAGHQAEVVWASCPSLTVCCVCRGGALHVSVGRCQQHPMPPMLLRFTLLYTLQQCVVLIPLLQPFPSHPWALQVQLTSCRQQLQMLHVRFSRPASGTHQCVKHVDWHMLCAGFGVAIVCMPPYIGFTLGP